MKTTFTFGTNSCASAVGTTVDIGMVFLFLGHFGHCVYEINRIGKIIELKRAFDVLLLQFPFRDFFHSLLELALFDGVSHNGTTSNTRKSFCNAKTSVCFYAVHPERAQRSREVPQHCLKASQREPSTTLYLLSAPLRMTATCRESF